MNKLNTTPAPICAIDLTTDEIVIFLREFPVSKAHVAPYGWKAEYSYTAADLLTANPYFTHPVYGKSVRDLYERLQKTFNRKDRHDALMSVVGGEVTEVYKLLGTVHEAREAEVMHRIESRVEVCDCKNRKLIAGTRLVSKARTGNTTTIILDDGSESNANSNVDRNYDGTNLDGASEDYGEPERRRFLTVNHACRFDKEMDRIGGILKERNDSQRYLDEKKLAMEERRLNLEECMREADQIGRYKEQDADAKSVVNSASRPSAFNYIISV